MTTRLRLINTSGTLQTIFDSANEFGVEEMWQMFVSLVQMQKRLKIICRYVNISYIWFFPH